MEQKDLKQAYLAFDSYVNQYDLKDTLIKMKYRHSYRVAELARKLALELYYKTEQVLLAELIGLLHDIGRFEQIKKTSSFLDEKFDHASYGVDYLFEQGHIRDFITDTKYDEMIRQAILYHNKLELPDHIEKDSLEFVYLIRDANKIGIYEQMAFSFAQTFDGNVSPKVRKDFLEEKPIRFEDVQTKADTVIYYFGYLFDLYYEESFDLLFEEDSFNLYLSCIEVPKEAEESFKEYKKICLDKIERGVLDVR